MLKDFEIPKVKDIGIAVVPTDDPNENIFNAYLINFKNIVIRNILVSSQGYGMIDNRKRKTAKFSHFLDSIPPRSYKLIEPLSNELLQLNNEFFVTFYIDNIIFDKKYIFLPETIIEENFITIRIVEKRGVLIK